MPPHPSFQIDVVSYLAALSVEGNDLLQLQFPDKGGSASIAYTARSEMSQPRERHSMSGKLNENTLGQISARRVSLGGKLANTKLVVNSVYCKYAQAETNVLVWNQSMNCRRLSIIILQSFEFSLMAKHATHMVEGDEVLRMVS
jgi:hypothetical protein